MYQLSKELIAKSRLILLGGQALVDSTETVIDYLKTGKVAEPDDIFGDPQDEVERDARRALTSELEKAMMHGVNIIKTLDKGYVGQFLRKMNESDFTE